jgi:predicted transcriptional regulator
MELVQLREKVSAQLDTVQDLALLQEIEQMLAAARPRSAQEMQFVNGLLALEGFANPEEALKEAEEQAERGEFVAHQQVLEMLKSKHK